MITPWGFSDGKTNPKQLRNEEDIFAVITLVYFQGNGV